jgi:DNA-binding PadR family transcriptional regulator
MSPDDISTDEVSMDNQQPLTESTFFILLALAEGPRHGYAILREVEELSDGRVKLSTGTLYGAIKRLLEANWIRKVDERDEPARDRQAYNLTSNGRTILGTEVRRLESLVRLSRARVARKEALS